MNNKDLEEANKEIESSKSDLQKPINTGREEKGEEEKIEKEEGSGIFTVDGKELPKIDGGYDIIEPGGTLGDDEFVSI